MMKCYILKYVFIPFLILKSVPFYFLHCINNVLTMTRAYKTYTKLEHATIQPMNSPFNLRKIQADQFEYIRNAMMTMTDANKSINLGTQC